MCAGTRVNYEQSGRERALLVLEVQGAGDEDEDEDEDSANRLAAY